MLDKYNLVIHDFGTVTHETNFSKIGKAVGTPIYAAPEVFKK